PNLARNCSKDALRVTLLERSQYLDRLQVWRKLPEEPPWRDLSRHQGVAGAKLAQRFQHVAELPHFDHGAFVLGKAVIERRVGLALEANQPYRNSNCAHRCGHPHRVELASRDQSNRGGPVKILR